MRKLVIVATLLFLQACSQEQPTSASADVPSTTIPSTTPLEEYEKLEKGAMAGDYQSQRNLAYWLSGGYNAPPQNPILACAWRLVILESGSPKVDAGDIGNKELYCDKRLGIDTDERKAAEAQAVKLRIQIR